MTRIVMGIDPGQSGGIAVLGQRSDVRAWAMGKTERDIYEQIHRHTCMMEIYGGWAFIEKVHSMPMPGKQCPLCKRKPSQGVSSTFKFGLNYGFLRGCVVACQMPWEEVAPVEWQRMFGLLKRKGETNVAKKNRHKAKAQELFPSINRITHAIADALLIAEYGRRALILRGSYEPLISATTKATASKA